MANNRANLLKLSADFESASGWVIIPMTLFFAVAMVFAGMGALNYGWGIYAIPLGAPVIGYVHLFALSTLGWAMTGKAMPAGHDHDYHGIVNCFMGLVQWLGVWFFFWLYSLFM